MASSFESSPLTDLLAEALPKDIPFTFYHVSTPPLKCPDIFAPTPGARPEKTYCESHFLNVSVSANISEQLVFAIEVLIYTTKHLTTLFVSKADSTGYITDLNLPRTQTSPLRSIAATFISFLARRRQRPETRLVVSLFARAASQYLYPGSVENGKKHVSDDRQLVKWWCRVLDPVLGWYAAEDAEDIEEATTAQAYLIVPGEDGIAHFLPPSVRADPTLRKRWKNGHPLREIAATPTAPPRCLIPHFPDDPKTRFLDELDDEIPDAPSSQQTSGTPSKRGAGQWKSVKTLEQFWDMMAYRQECSSGRLVGFIWVVMTPPDARLEGEKLPLSSSSSSPPKSDKINAETSASTPTPVQLDGASESRPIRSTKSRSKPARPPSGRIISRVPKIKSKATEAPAKSIPEKSKYYLWPTDSRGEILLDAREYKRANELLLRLDFANEVIASSSSKRWIEEVGLLGGISSGNWGISVTGRKQATIASGPGSGTNTLNILTIKSKRKAEADANSVAPTDTAPNVLSSGLVRKKPKVETESSVQEKASEVNVLSSGLVRKKSKT